MDSDLQLRGRGLHIFRLGPMVEMSMELTEPIFKNKILWTFLGENGKLFVVVKSLQ